MIEEARQRIAKLAQQYPEHTEVDDLKTAIEEDIQVQIEMTFLGGPEGHYEPDAQTIMYTLEGREEGFRVTVWPLEQVYLYLYVRHDSGVVASLLPALETIEAERYP